jgi:hypothetical protein
VRRLAFLASVVAFSAIAVSARADVTTWLALGTGAGVDHSTTLQQTNLSAAFSMSMGVGSDPTHPVVVGGVFRSLTRFDQGTDFGFAVRATTGSFARGDWGFGLDLGPGFRFWSNNDFGTYPLQAALLFGAPWGLQATLGTDIANLGGHPASLGGYLLVELDLIRLTVMRQGSSEARWPNPIPAGGRMPPEEPPGGH